MDVLTPTKARKEFFKLLEEVSSSHKPVHIHGKNDVVMIDKSDWDAVMETLYLYENGVADRIKEAEERNEFEVLEEKIDWDTL